MAASRVRSSPLTAQMLSVVDHRLVLCSTDDDYILSQDICSKCGSLGKGDEGNLISCIDCGQCYHPYCVNLTNLRLIVTKGWRCDDCSLYDDCVGDDFAEQKPENEQKHEDEKIQGESLCDDTHAQLSQDYIAVSPIDDHLAPLTTTISSPPEPTTTIAAATTTTIAPSVSTTAAATTESLMSADPSINKDDNNIPVRATEERMIELASQHHLQDGVYLSDAGLRFIKNLQIEPAKRQRAKRGSRLQAKSDDSSGQQTGPIKDDDVFEDGKSNNVDDKTIGGEETEKKKRQRKLSKVGIGGFGVPKRGSRLFRDDDSQEQTNAGASSPPEFSTDSNVKPKRNRKKAKKKPHMSDSYPPYIQEAFFGKDLCPGTGPPEPVSDSLMPQSPMPSPSTVNNKSPKSQLMSPLPTKPSQPSPLLHQSPAPMTAIASQQPAQVPPPNIGSPHPAPPALQRSPHPQQLHHQSPLQHQSHQQPIHQQPMHQHPIHQQPMHQQPMHPQQIHQQQIQQQPPMQQPMQQQPMQPQPMQQQPMQQQPMQQQSMQPQQIHHQPMNQQSSLQQPLPPSRPHSGAMPISHPSPAQNVSMPMMSPSISTPEMQYQMPASPWASTQEPRQFSPHTPNDPNWAPSSSDDADNQSQGRKTLLKWEADEKLGDFATASPVLYANLMHPNLKAEFPSWQERAKKIQKLWRDLDGEKRKPYLQKARENRSANRTQQSEASSTSQKQATLPVSVQINQPMVSQVSMPIVSTNMSVQPTQPMPQMQRQMAPPSIDSSGETKWRHPMHSPSESNSPHSDRRMNAGDSPGPSHQMQLQQQTLQTGPVSQTSSQQSPYQTPPVQHMQTPSGNFMDQNISMQSSNMGGKPQPPQQYVQRPQMIYNQHMSQRPVGPANHQMMPPQGPYNQVQGQGPARPMTRQANPNYMASQYRPQRYVAQAGGHQMQHMQAQQQQQQRMHVSPQQQQVVQQQQPPQPYMQQMQAQTQQVQFQPQQQQVGVFPEPSSHDIRMHGHQNHGHPQSQMVYMGSNHPQSHNMQMRRAQVPYAQQQSMVQQQHQTHPQQQHPPQRMYHPQQHQPQQHQQMYHPQQPCNQIMRPSGDQRNPTKSPIVGDSLTSVEFLISDPGPGRDNEAVNFPMTSKPTMSCTANSSSAPNPPSSSISATASINNSNHAQNQGTIDNSSASQSSRKNELAARRAALEKEPTPPKDEKPKRKARGPNKRKLLSDPAINHSHDDALTIDGARSKSGQSQPTSRKRIRKSASLASGVVASTAAGSMTMSTPTGSMASTEEARPPEPDAREDLLSEITARIKSELPPMHVRDSELRSDLNICPIFSSGNLNSTKSKLRGKFGHGVPIYHLGAFKERREVSFYQQEFPSDLNEPSIDTYNARLSPDFHEHNYDSSDEEVGPSSPESEDSSPNDDRQYCNEKCLSEFCRVSSLHKSALQEEELKSDDKNHETKGDSINDKDHNKENSSDNHKQGAQNPDGTSLNMLLKDHGNVAVTLTLTDDEADRVKKILSSLSRLLQITTPISCRSVSPDGADIDNRCDDISVGPRGIGDINLMLVSGSTTPAIDETGAIQFNRLATTDVDIKPTMEIEELLDKKPEFCAACRAHVTDSGIKKKLKDNHLDDANLCNDNSSIAVEATFCSVTCYTQFICAIKTEDEHQPNHVSVVDEPSLAVIETSGGSTFNSQKQMYNIKQLPGNLPPMSPMMEDDEEEPNRQLSIAGPIVMPPSMVSSPELEKKHSISVENSSTPKDHQKASSLVEILPTQIEDQEKSVAMSVDRSDQGSQLSSQVDVKMMLDVSQQQKPCTENDRMQDDEDYEMTHLPDTYDVQVRIWRDSGDTDDKNRANDTRKCVLCQELGDGDTNGPARLLNIDLGRWVHINCALWSSEVREHNGELRKVEEACNKAQTCPSCNQPGATIRCAAIGCLVCLHFKCCIKEQCSFYEDKSVLCQQHAQTATQAYTPMKSFVVKRRVFVARDEHRQAADMIQNEQRGVLRIGSLVFLNSGQLLPYQLKAFHSEDSIYPIGYKVIRFYWSFRRLDKRCKYICIIQDDNGRPEFKIDVEEPGFANTSFIDASPMRVWRQVLDKILELRQTAQDRIKDTDASLNIAPQQTASSPPTVTSINTQLQAPSTASNSLGTATTTPATASSLTMLEIPEHIKGEDLFGLTEPCVLRILESLPGIESLLDYKFKYDRSKSLQLPLPIIPSGCARAEPIAHFKLPRIVSKSKPATSSRKLQPLNSNDSLYKKQTEYPKPSQYRKMKSEWRNNVKLARSDIQGLGLYAARDIKKYTMIIEYTGYLIRNEIAEIMERRHEEKGRGIYMFRLDDDWVIDATESGGLARYINHSCNPNCVAETVEIDRERKILIIASRDIEQGEELGYNYNLAPEDDQHKILCLCGAQNCRKWLN
ncbi:Histone-lysine N-methyltransferase trr [Fragariocoptes setiger]|uniref:Histone-lysine N-methyltransferase trr n=1 Tax=Fragariocoptes setiger TaxID=1670756 RepID=A0ABQ7S9X5_9ACAR|nr:Histone-lysine N-methyltransferase trr [Fragariocoptes setiger]